MNMREIPTLQEICLRSVGSHACSTEKTFARSSWACDLLRSLSSRCPRIPCIGTSSGRKGNHYPPNEVDLHHPFATVRNEQQELVLEYGNTALDVLQLYIDTLVEMGRFDDARLGAQFFQQWKDNCLVETDGAIQTKDEDATAAGADNNNKSATKETLVQPSPKKRPRRGMSQQQIEASLPEKVTEPPEPSGKQKDQPQKKLTAISFHNCTLGETTIGVLIESGLCEHHLAVLDLTGVRGLTDVLASSILVVTPHLKRLSVKNCRKLTKCTLETLATHNLQITSLDIGGCGNMTPYDVLSHIPPLPHLVELHASGLLWSDADLKDLVKLKKSWKKISLGFSRFTQSALRESLLEISDSLTSLALPFCETVVDNALLGILGRNLPYIRSLDLRGNPNLYTLTGFYDGRASADLAVDDTCPLTVLARYTGITENSVEETRRIHPTVQLDVHLGTGGMGAGIDSQ